MQKNIISKFLLLLCFTSFLQATPLDDVFDVSPRIQALGGAGVALSEDASAAYYNPANLSRCLKNSVVLGYNLVSSNLRVFDKNGKVVPSTQVGNLNIGYLGACFPVWSKWNLGFYLSTPLEVPLELGDIETLNSTPRFFMYDASVKAPSAWVGLSFKPFKKLSVGLGATFSAGVMIKQRAMLPVFESTISPQLIPRVGLVTGGLIEVIEDKVRLSFVFRQSSSGLFKVDANSQIDVLGRFGTPFEASFQLESILNYSPSQLALGVVYKPSSAWTIGGDITCYLWSAYEGPFMKAFSKNETFLNNRLTMPANETFDFQNNFVPRLGVEHALNEKVFLRAGYAFLTSPLPLKQGNLMIVNTNTLLFNHVHRVSLGTGYRVLAFDTWNLYADAFMVLDMMTKTKVYKSKPAATSFTFEGTAINTGLALKVEY